MQTTRTEAIILRRTNFGEADRILNLLTPEHGKITAIAKGVRKPKSKLAGGLELFAACDVTIRQGRGDMGLVTSSQLVKFYGNILQSYERMNLGYDFIKLINRATQTVSESDFYYLLRDSLAYLDELGINYSIIELWFRLQLLSLLGVGLNLKSSTDGAALSIERIYNFDFTEMAFSAVSSGRFNPDHIKLLRLASTKTPAVLNQVSGIETLLEDCLWLVRTME